ncbi:protein kinase rio1 [Tulasnella sp. 427]|nr:protein kinase rio1 [Tulasnella sp. 427]
MESGFKAREWLGQVLNSDLDSIQHVIWASTDRHDSRDAPPRIDDHHGQDENLPSLQELMNELQAEEDYLKGSSESGDSLEEGAQADFDDEWVQDEIRPEDEDWEVAEKDFTKQYNRLRQHAAVYNRTAQPEATSKQKGPNLLSLPPVNKPQKVPKPTSTTPAPAVPNPPSSKLSITTDQLALLQKYNSRLANLSEPYNALGMGAGVNRKGPSAVANRKDKADRATTEQVLDPRTRLILYKMIGRGVIFEVNGCISTGKEANVYHALSPEQAHIALKIYKTSILVFKDRDRYVTGEHRFRRGYAKHNPRKMVRLWAEKEMRNLKRLTEANVRCPEPIEVRENVLVMQFLGNSEGWPSPRLKDADVPPELLPSLYAELLITVRILFHACRLVHADLSEYNILFHRSHLYMIDVSQSVEHDHPHALEFLRTDLTNVDEWFKKRGVRTLGLRRSFDFVVSSEESFGKGKEDEDEGVPTLIPAAEPGEEPTATEALPAPSTTQAEGPKYAKTMEYKYLESTLAEWLSEDTANVTKSQSTEENPDGKADVAVDQAQEDAVFRSSYIPRTLNEVVDPERDAEIIRRGEGKSLIYDGVIGVTTSAPKTTNEIGVSKEEAGRALAEDISTEGEEEDDDEEGLSDSGEGDEEETRTKKPKGRRGEDKEAKKAGNTRASTRNNSPDSLIMFRSGRNFKKRQPEKKGKRRCPKLRSKPRSERQSDAFKRSSAVAKQGTWCDNGRTSSHGSSTRRISRRLNRTTTTSRSLTPVRMPKAADPVVIPPLANIDGKFTCIGNGLLYEGHPREKPETLRVLLMPSVTGEAIGDRARPKAWWTAQSVFYDLPCPKTASIPTIRALLERAIKSNSLALPEKLKTLENKSNREFKKLNKEVLEKTGAGPSTAAKAPKPAEKAPKPTKTTDKPVKVTEKASKTLEKASSKPKVEKPPKAPKLVGEKPAPAPKPPKVKPSSGPSTSSAGPAPKPVKSAQKAEPAAVKRKTKAKRTADEAFDTKGKQDPPPVKRPRAKKVPKPEDAAEPKLEESSWPTEIYEEDYALNRRGSSTYDSDGDYKMEEDGYGYDVHGHDDYGHDDSDELPPRNRAVPPTCSDFIAGSWVVSCPYIYGQWGRIESHTQRYTINIVRTNGHAHIAADFELGIVHGTLRSKTLEGRPDGAYVTFEWVGEEEEGPILPPRREQAGYIKFLKDGTCKGKINGIDVCPDDVDFEAWWIGPPGKNQWRWEDFDEEAYENARVGRWGGGF